MSAVPGVNAKHAIITPTCRANRTSLGAFEEAVARLKREYLACLNRLGENGANYHVVLSVESIRFQRKRKERRHGQDEEESE